MLTVAEAVQFLDQFAPPDLAADWDNTGLLLGDTSAPVERIMTCLTVTPDSVSEAIDAGVHLIVSHHPILFKSTKRMTTATSEGRLLLALAQSGVGVYSPHTSFDNTHGGINEILAGRLKLTDVVPLRQREGGRQYKIIVFVPEADLAAVSDAMFEAGAGKIGNYAECSFRLKGTGTFFGSESARPSVGHKGKREEVSEWRLESVCAANRIQEVVAAIRHSHSYEEPAFDICPLDLPPSSLGVGRLGRRQSKVSLKELAQEVKTSLKTPLVQIVGDPNRLVERVAIVCGAGGDFVPDAVRRQADVLVTGEARFHDYLAALAQGVALLLPGHYASERCGVEEMARRLQEQWPKVQVWASRRECDPLQTA